VCVVGFARIADGDGFDDDLSVRNRHAQQENNR
jgi:hypothetical protein